METLRKGIEAAHVEKAYRRLASDASRMKEDGMWDSVAHDCRVDLVFISDIDVMGKIHIRAEIEGGLLTLAELESFLPRSGPKLSPEESAFAQVPRCVKL